MQFRRDNGTPVVRRKWRGRSRENWGGEGGGEEERGKKEVSGYSEASST